MINLINYVPFNLNVNVTIVVIPVVVYCDVLTMCVRVCTVKKQKKKGRK